MNVLKNRIIPHLWFDKEAAEAIDFYITVFNGSKYLNHSELDGTPSGRVGLFSFEISGQELAAINAGTYFRFNDSVSFFYYCGSEEEIDRIYGRLAENGTILFPLGKYVWSRKYAWVRDRFGIGWQLDIDDINSDQKVVPALLFVNEKSARVREAIKHYMSVFRNSRLIMEAPVISNEGKAGDDLLFAQFRLENFIFNAMSSPHKHDFDFNEAVSFMIMCRDQEEVDYYWERLGAGGEEQPCGWLKDCFGVSWQVIPSELSELMSGKDMERSGRVMAALMKMKRIDISLLRNAYEGLH